MTTIANLTARVDSDTSDAERGIAGFLNKITQLGVGVFAFKQLTDAAGEFTKAMFGQAATMEQTRIAFKGLLGSMEAGNAFINQLQAFAASTPFEFTELTDAARKFLAFGFSAEQVIPIMKSVGNAVATMGGGKAEIDRVTRALGQMQAKGKVTAGEMNQIAELGIGGWEMLASKLGKTVAETMAMSEKGLISASVAIPALLEGMGKMGGGAMLEEQSKTINGLLSTMSDNATQAWIAFTEPILNSLKPALEVVADLLSGPAFMNFAKDFGENAGNAISGTIQTVQGLAEALLGLENTDALQLGLEKLFGVDSAQVGIAMDAVETFKQALAGDWVNADSILPLHQMVGNFGLLLSQQIIPAVMGWAAAMQESWMPVINQAIETGQHFGTVVMATLLDVWQKSQPAVMMVVGALGEMAGQLPGLAGPVGALASGLGYFAEQVVIAGGAVLGSIIPPLLQLLSFILPSIIPMIGEVATQIGVSFSLIGDMIGETVTLVQAIIDGNWAAAWNSAGGLLNTFMELFTGLMMSPVKIVDAATFGMLSAWQKWITDMTVKTLEGMGQIKDGILNKLGEIDLGKWAAEQVAAIASSILGAIPGVADALAKLRGLFPSSPAEWGPFETLPNWESVFGGIEQAGATATDQAAEDVATLAELMNQAAATIMAGAGGGSSVANTLSIGSVAYSPVVQDRGDGGSVMDQLRAGRDDFMDRLAETLETLATTGSVFGGA